MIINKKNKKNSILIIKIKRFLKTNCKLNVTKQKIEKITIKIKHEILK